MNSSVFTIILKFNLRTLLLVVLAFLAIPGITRADCPNDFVDIGEQENFIVSKDKGAIFDISVDALPPHINISSSSLILYLESGENIKNKSEFVIYPLDFQNKKLTGDKIVINAEIKIKDNIKIDFPPEKLDFSQSRIGFILCTSEDSRFSFAGDFTNERSPYLSLTFSEGVDTKVANFIHKSEVRNNAYEDYAKRTEAIKQQEEKFIRDMIRDIIVGILVAIIVGIIVFVPKKIIYIIYKKVRSIKYRELFFKIIRWRLKTLYICGTQKYQLAGPKVDSIGLQVKIANLPKEIEVEGYKLLSKSSFHVSLVCIGKIAEKYKITKPDFINEIVSDFCGFIQNKNIDFIRFRDEFRFAAQNERRSVVVMCDISNLDEFYKIINKKYGLTLEVPPTHITLYTLQPDAGIFLVDTNDINTLTKVIDAPFIL